jgi:acetyl-CoA carboxylase biotin carboxyl carrier protein
MMDFQQIQELIKLVNKSKLSEFVLKEGDFKLVIKAQSEDEPMNASQPTLMYQPAALPLPVQQAPAPAATPAPQTTAAQTESAPTPAAPPGSASNTKEIRSPMVGTFYRSAGPDKPQFVKIGDEVQVGQTVCIIEAMKLFNELESDLSGKIVKVLVDDGKPVEYDQPLFLVEIA